MLLAPPPQVVAIFGSPSAFDWLNQMVESNAVSSAILVVIHPHLYAARQQTLSHLWLSPEIRGQDVLKLWNSAFSRISVIFNGRIQAHRDSQSRYHWYDLLVTLGHYQNCVWELPGDGISLDYGPGTVVGLLGMVLQHQVSRVVGEGGRYAHFM